MITLYQTSTDYLAPRIVGTFSDEDAAGAHAWQYVEQLDRLAFLIVRDDQLLYFCNPIADGWSWEPADNL